MERADSVDGEREEVAGVVGIGVGIGGEEEPRELGREGGDGGSGGAPRGADGAEAEEIGDVGEAAGDQLDEVGGEVGPAAAWGGPLLGHWCWREGRGPLHLRNEKIQGFYRRIFGPTQFCTDCRAKKYPFRRFRKKKIYSVSLWTLYY